MMTEIKNDWNKKKRKGIKKLINKILLIGVKQNIEAKSFFAVNNFQ